MKLGDGSLDLTDWRVTDNDLWRLCGGFIRSAEVDDNWRLWEELLPLLSGVLSLAVSCVEKLVGGGSSILFVYIQVQCH
jgi:hypothetical protein